MPIRKRRKTWWLDFRVLGKRYRIRAGTSAKEAQKALDRIQGRVATGEWKPEELNPAVVADGVTVGRD